MSTAAGGPTLGDTEFRAMQRLVLELTGITINDSRRLMLQSRLLPRLTARGFTSFSEYHDLLHSARGRADETQALINCVTTNKTSFFREPHQFTALAKEWLPQMIARARAGGPRKLRLWSAACSTGAEPWTLAMVLFDGLPELATWDVKVLASDIDTDVLERASQGLYDELELEGLDAARRDRHFERVGAQWRVKDHLRRLVAFKRINFLEPVWPIRTRFDVVLCRNASIYFDAPTQRRLFERLTQVLEPGAWLLVGHAEVLHGFEHVLQGRPGGMYRRRSDGQPPTPAPRSLAAPHLATAPNPSAPPRPVTPPAIKQEPGEHIITVGELHAAKQPTVISTLLGSCVAACLFDPVSKIGGMNHFLLPDAHGDEANGSRFGVHAMETLINSLMKLGADRHRLEARLYGGANVLTSLTSRPTIGERNAAFARAFLEREKIPLVASKLGGDRGLHVTLESHTGNVTTREIGHEQIDTRRELAAVHQTPDTGGDVELFIDV